MKPIRLVSALALVSLALSAHAGELYDNFFSGPEAYAPTRYPISPGYPLAFRFVATGTGRVAGFTAPIKSFFGDTMPFTVALYDDAPDQIVGSRIASGAGETSFYELDGNYTETVHVPILDGPVLRAGEAYWVEVDFLKEGSWPLAVLGEATKERFGGNYYGDGPVYLPGFTPAFSLQAVPEPSALVALGLPALALLRRRKLA